MAITNPNDKVTKILSIQVDSEKAIDTLKQLSDIIADVKSQEAKLTKEIEENTKTQKLSQAEIEAKKKEIQALKQAEKDYRTMVNEVSRAVQNELKADRSKLGSLKQLRAEMSNLTKQYDEMSRADREGLKGKQLLKDIQNLTKEIKDAEYATMRYQRNVGNYGSALAGLRERYAGVADGIARTSSAIRTGFIGIAAGVVLVKRAIWAITNEYKTITDFEQANANLSTILGVTKDQMETLRESALHLGETTEYTASQVTSLQTELAKLGFTQREILNMQKPVLQFATAVGADLASAAALAGATLRAFELDSSKTEDVLATLSVATNKSALSFSMLQTSMSTIAPVANAYGLSVKDTTALLGTLANAGFDATSAATATRNILLNLANDSGKLARTLGGSVTTFNDIMDALIKLRDSGVNLNETLELTDKMSVAAFNAFLSSAEASKALREELENVDGELERIQSQRLDTVEGSIKLMQSAWEGFILSMSNSTGTIKSVIDTITAGITTINNLINPSSSVSDEAKSMTADNLREQYLRMLDPDKFDEYVAEQLAEYDRRIDKQARKTKMSGWIAAYMPWRTGRWAENKGVLTAMEGEKEVFAQAAKSEEVSANLSFEQRLKQLDNVYKRKVEEYQNDMTISRQRAEELTREADEKYMKERQAIIREEAMRRRAADAAAVEDEKRKNGKIIAEDEKAQKARERQQREQERKTKQYNDLLFREQQKAEDALVNLITDSRERRAALEDRNYEKQKAAIEKAMREEAAARGQSTELYMTYLQQLETLETQHQLNVERIQLQFRTQDLRITEEIYRTKISIAEKNSREQFELRKEMLGIEMELELANTELTEEQRQSIREKYANQEAQLRDEQAKAVADQVTKEWEARILQAQIEGEDYEALEMEMLKERLDSLQQYELESQQDFINRKLAAEKAYLDRKQQLSQREMKIEQDKASGVANVIGSVSKLMEEAGKENEELTRLSKMLALAEIAINTGVAISKGIAQSQLPFPANIGAMATTISAIMTGITSAISTVAGAKLSGGGKVSGPGTATSDSVPAMLSDGEVVVNTASAEKYPTLLHEINTSSGGAGIPHPNELTFEEKGFMRRIRAKGFARGGLVGAGGSTFPDLAMAIADLGAGISVPVQNQTTYSFTTLANAAGGITPEQLAEALRQMPPVEVAVKEIERVDDRVKVIENLRTY